MGTLTSAQARALNDQYRAPNIKHVSSAELFSRFPDRNAGETLQRMPGVALDRDQVEGEFVQVRGLNASAQRGGRQRLAISRAQCQHRRGPRRRYRSAAAAPRRADRDNKGAHA